MNASMTVKAAQDDSYTIPFSSYIIQGFNTLYVPSSSSSSGNVTGEISTHSHLSSSELDAYYIDTCFSYFHGYITDSSEVTFGDSSSAESFHCIDKSGNYIYKNLYPVYVKGSFTGLYSDLQSYWNGNVYKLDIPTTSTFNGTFSDSSSERTVSFNVFATLSEIPELSGSYDFAMILMLPEGIKFSLPNPGRVLIPSSSSVVLTNGSSLSYVADATVSISYPYLLVSGDFRFLTEYTYDQLRIGFTFDLPEGYSFTSSSNTYSRTYSNTEHTGDRLISFFPSSSTTIINNIESANGSNSEFNDSINNVNSTFSDYEEATDTSEIYDSISDSFFVFDTSVFTQIAATSTFFASIVTGLWSAFGDFSIPLQMFLISTVVSIVLGIIKVVNESAKGG